MCKRVGCLFFLFFFFLWMNDAMSFYEYLIEWLLDTQVLCVFRDLVRGLWGTVEVGQRAGS